MKKIVLSVVTAIVFTTCLSADDYVLETNYSQGADALKESLSVYDLDSTIEQFKDLNNKGFISRNKSCEIYSNYIIQEYGELNTVTASLSNAKVDLKRSLNWNTLCIQQSKRIAQGNSQEDILKLYSLAFSNDKVYKKSVQEIVDILESKDILSYTFVEIYKAFAAIIDSDPKFLISYKSFLDNDGKFLKQFEKNKKAQEIFIKYVDIHFDEVEEEPNPFVDIKLASFDDKTVVEGFQKLIDNDSGINKCEEIRDGDYGFQELCTQHIKRITQGNSREDTLKLYALFIAKNTILYGGLSIQKKIDVLQYSIFNSHFKELFEGYIRTELVLFPSLLDNYKSFLDNDGEFLKEFEKNKEAKKIYSQFSMNISKTNKKKGKK